MNMESEGRWSGKGLFMDCAPLPNGNHKYFLELLTVLDFPEAEMEYFSKFVILPANQPSKIIEMG